MNGLMGKKYSKMLMGLLVLFLVFVLSPASMIAAAPVPGPAPAVTINDTTNRVSGMATSMEYSLDGAAYIKYNLNAFNAINFSGQHTLLVRYAATKLKPASLVKTLIFTPNVLVAPAAPKVTNNDSTNRVYGMTAKMEYSLDSNPAYVMYNATTFNAINFAGSHTLLVRYAATATASVSLPTTLVFTPNAGKAKVLFTFDDGWLDTYTKAFPILKAAGFKGTVYVCRDIALGTNSGMMRTADILKLYQNGWDIGNHTINHAEIGSGTTPAELAELKRIYQENQNWIVQQFGARGAFHACYASGNYTPQLIDVLKGLGVMTTRATMEANQPTPVTNVANYYELPCQALESKFASDDEDPVEKASDTINDAITTGSTVIFMIHKVETAKTDADDLILTTGDLSSIVNFIKGKADQVSVMTMNEWYTQASITLQTPAAPAVTRDDATNIVSGLTTGMEYNLDGTGYVAYNPTVFSNLKLTGYHTLLVRQAATSAIPSGLPVVLLFSADPGAAKVLFTFYDGWKDQATYAYPVLESAGFKGTVYVSRDLILSGLSDKMNIADLQTLYNEDWDIGNRTYNRQNINGLDEPAILDLYSQNQQWINSNNWLRGANHASYPDNQYSSLLFSALRSLGVLTGMTENESVLATPVTDPDGLYKLPVITIYNDDPYYIAKAKTAIDQAVFNGDTVIFAIHQVEPGISGAGSTLSVAGLQEIVQYAAKFTQTGRLSNMTISEWYAAQPK